VSVIEGTRRRQPNRHPDEPARLRRVVIIGVLLLLAAGLTWWFTKPSRHGDALAASASSNVLVVRIGSPTSTAPLALPSATMSFEGTTSRMYIRAATGWDIHEPTGFPAMGGDFSDPLPAGTKIAVLGDATEASVSTQRTGQGHPKSVPLRLQDGTARLPERPGSYSVDVIGYWPQGQAHFDLYVTVSSAQQFRRGAAIRRLV
jgi:hypothetical protein